MIKCQRLLAAEKVRAEIEEIEHQAMSAAGWLEYLAQQRSDEGRDSAMSAALSDDQRRLRRWRALRLALPELERI